MSKYPKGTNVIKSTADVEIKDIRASGNTERIVDNTIQLLFGGFYVAVVDHVDKTNCNTLLLNRILTRLRQLNVFQRTSIKNTRVVSIKYDSNLNYNILKLEFNDTSKNSCR